jgi:hypothetical protein
MLRAENYLFIICFVILNAQDNAVMSVKQRGLSGAK